MDSSVSPTHGDQEMSVWNGHYACTCYHPLFLFNQFGDLERCALRPGNVHSADGWHDVLDPVVARYRGKVSRLYFRADAAFAMPGSTSSWKPSGSNMRSAFPPTASCRTGSAICSSARSGVPRTMCGGSTPVSPIRPEAGPSRAGLSPKSSGIRASLFRASASSSPTCCARPSGLSPSTISAAQAEQWIKEGKGAIKWTRLSCRTFAANAVRLQLHALAYNLGNFLRTLATPEPIKEWSLTSLREKLIKIGAKLVSHGRYVAFQMAEVAVPRMLFAEILRLIAELRPPPDPAPA